VGTPPDLSTLLQAAGELAALTGRTALEQFRHDLTIETKPDGSPVTIADRQAERQARDWLARRFPEDGILGEEEGTTVGRSGRTWLLDPIDGTKSFVRGVPLWGSLVALVEQDRVLAGAAAFPAVGEHLSAARGAGCWHNGTRCRVSSQAELARATALTSEVERFATPEARRAWDALAQAVTVTRTWGDCYGYLLVATGRAELMVDVGLHPWDIACFVPIIEEAGGRITDLEGGAYPPLENAIATNTALADEVRRIWSGAAR
jgi:histidinol phosphatase-like enzyme (inositol monophosphatase family)